MGILGICGSNPNKDSPCLELEFDRYIHPVSFPTDAQIEQYANFLNSFDPNSAQARGSTTAPVMVGFIQEIHLSCSQTICIELLEKDGS